MKKKILSLLLFFITSHVAHAVSADHAPSAVVDTQQDSPDTYVPLVENYPSFMIEFLGMDYLYNLDPKVSSPFHKIKKFDWHSLFRGDGVVLYAIRIYQSRFAFCPGVGWSTLYYPFSGKGTGDETIYPTLKRESQWRTECLDLDNRPGKKISSSAVKISFINFLLRFRFNSVLDEPKQGFHSWLGLKLGIRASAATIVHYIEYDDTSASSICKGHFNLNRYAVGLQAGVGYYRFGLMGSFHLTPLFKQSQGPSNSDSLRPCSFGIYMDLL